VEAFDELVSVFFASGFVNPIPQRPKVVDVDESTSWNNRRKFLTMNFFSRCLWLPSSPLVIAASGDHVP
jgi:hypothetical protein